MPRIVEDVSYNDFYCLFVQNSPGSGAVCTIAVRLILQPAQRHRQ